MNLLPTIRGIRARLHQMLAWLLMILLGLFISLATLNLAAQWLGAGLPWSEPILRHTLLQLTLLGAISATDRHQHIQIGLVHQIAPDWAARHLRRFVHFVAFTISVLLAQASWHFVLAERLLQTSAWGDLPLWPLQSILPIGFALNAMVAALGMVDPAQKEARSGDAI